MRIHTCIAYRTDVAISLYGCNEQTTLNFDIGDTNFSLTMSNEQLKQLQDAVATRLLACG